METITLTRPDDWHLHLRDGDYLATTVPATARCFGRAIVMPNLVLPLTALDQVAAYRDRILEISGQHPFIPLMTLYLTDNLMPSVIREGADRNLITACKLYPAGATTHSDAGVTNIANIYPLLEVMTDCAVPLLIHGEVTTPGIDIFDREKVFIDTILIPLITKFPHLKIVLEHITTKEAVDFVQESSNNIAATITPHHLLLNRNDMLVSGIKPHYYCLPIIKRAEHQRALIQAATSGHTKYFLGTDSAPHAISQKETACGCAGIFSAHAAIEIYASIFEEHQALDKLESFASFNGAKFYGLPQNRDTITLEKKPWQVPQVLSFGKDQLKPLLAGETLAWQLKS